MSDLLFDADLQGLIEYFTGWAPSEGTVIERWGPVQTAQFRSDVRRALTEYRALRQERAKTNVSALEGLDRGIERYVVLLMQQGIETFESCEGGAGHAYPEPTIRFHGNASEGFRAFAVAMTFALPVSDLRRTWPVIDGAPTGPYWELTFFRKADAVKQE